MTGIIVLKFGGASVSSPESFASISNIIIARKSIYKNVVVVVSAMGDTTDELIALAYRVNKNPPRRELDMLISVGERISVALLAMAIASKGFEAISFTGSQAGIITTNHHSDAKIMTVRPHRLVPQMDLEKIIIVAGFQGMSKSGEITTLGRGGSDTTAVALAIALDAEKVEFFKDVPGIFEQDPKKNPQAKFLTELNYDEAYNIVNAGAQVLHSRCILLAKKNHIPLHVLPFGEDTSIGTLIRQKNNPLFSQKEKKYEEDFP